MIIHVDGSLRSWNRTQKISGGGSVGEEDELPDELKHLNKD